MKDGILGLFAQSGENVILDSLSETILFWEVVAGGQETSEGGIQILLKLNHFLKQVVVGTEQLSTAEFGELFTKILEGKSQFSNLSACVRSHTSLLLLVTMANIIFQKLSNSGCLIASAVPSCIEGGLVAARTSRSFLEAKFLVFSSSISFSYVSCSFSCHHPSLVRVFLFDVVLRSP
jgi:hypothetical protein